MGVFGFEITALNTGDLEEMGVTNFEDFIFKKQLIRRLLELSILAESFRVYTTDPKGKPISYGYFMEKLNDCNKRIDFLRRFL